MKRCTPNIVLRHKRLARYSKAKRQRQFDQKKCGVHASGYVPPGKLIEAPKIINLKKPDGVHLERFIHAVERTVLSLHKKTRLNFKKTEKLHVAGAILLFAELDRIIRLSTLQKPITIIEPKQRRAREVLKQIGFLQLTGDVSDIIPLRDDVVFWKATKGADQTGDTLGSILECVAERANREHIAQIELSGIWRGVSEAVANTVDHAYLRQRSDGFPSPEDTKWWMFTQVRDNSFTVAVCDLGCGYRATVKQTIPEKFRSKMAEMLIGKNPDAVAIQTAMEYGRSGTQETHRGKGSRDALSLLKMHGAGSLHVLSNTGWVRYDYDNGAETNVGSGGTGTDIRGTIIWWKLPLKKE